MLSLPEFLLRAISLAVAALSLGVAGYFAISVKSAEKRNVDWPRYGRNLANTRFQDVDQINSSNAAKLCQARTIFGSCPPNGSGRVSDEESALPQ